jgi:uncharacterized protein
MHIEKDIEKIKSLAFEKEDENWRFRAFLKSSDMSIASMDRMVAVWYEDVRQTIDCRTCGHCCMVMAPMLTGRDMNRLVSHLGVSRKELIDKHLEPSKEDKGYTTKELPCPFLKDMQCTVYDARPDTCRSYPHLHKHEFRSRLMQVIDNCSVCPIVYNVYEGLKSELWRRSGKRW